MSEPTYRCRPGCGAVSDSEPEMERHRRGCVLALRAQLAAALAERDAARGALERIRDDFGSSAWPGCRAAACQAEAALAETGPAAGEER